ncbi:MAG: trypsin-like peptidase domain-containing protein [Agathobacter sp.]|nr:trypsin-like peptidase domain-containing protein [Agathobacter sp.]
MENNFNNNQYNYNPYKNPEQGYQHSTNEKQTYADSGSEMPKEKKGPFAGFGVTLVKTVTIALVFGLVAGVAGSTVLQFSGITLGIFSEKEEEKDSSKDKDESEDKRPEGGLQQTDTDVQGTVAIMDVSDIVTNVMPSVVAITNIAEVQYQSFWGQVYTEEVPSAGSGFLVEQDNEFIYIATNNHVVADATELTVQFCDGSTAAAEIKGTVASKDLAVIKVAIKDIDADTLEVIRIATLGDSTAIEVGEAAIAIGNALGYGQSVTTGVISALGRSVSVADSSTGTTVVNNNLIQTDAAINPGNSGGALLNIHGEVIGINSVKYADTNVEGIGYAIPINDAMLIIDKMIDGEKIDESQSGYLGVQGRDSSLGAYVHSVIPGSAAQKAGIKAGDIITEFEGTTIATMSQLKELLSYYPAGEKVDFVILRPQGNDEYKEIEITVELGNASILQMQ